MIDIHSHFFPPLSFEQAQNIDKDWPWLDQHSEERGFIMQGRERFRPARAPLWSAAARLEELDNHGIDTQVICATPILFGYDRQPEVASAAAVMINDLALSYCRENPVRLKCLCQVPLQSLKHACDELDRAMASGHIGVQIGNHVAARDMDDGELIEFLQHCAAVDAPVLVHPWDMMGRERMDRYMLQWLVAMPAETQLSILYLILSGAFERLPTKLRICFAHGGGSFAYLLGRVDNAWKHRDIVSENCPNVPSSYCDRFYTDSILFEPSALSLLIETMGEQRVLFGTDYPFPLGEQKPGETINNHPTMSAACRHRLLSENAIEFFGERLGR